MHVLLLTDSYPNAYLPGQGSFVHDQAQCLASEGMHVGVLALIPVSWNDLLKRGFRDLKFTVRKGEGISIYQCCYAQLPKLYRYPIHKSLTAGKPMVKRYVAEFGKPDVLHVHGFHCAALALWVAKEYEIPLVVTEHNSRILNGTLDQARLRVAVDLYQTADACIAVSRALAKRIELLAGRSIEVVPNVIDSDFFTTGIPNQGCVFLSAGNFTANKNQLLQLQAFAAARNQMPDAQLWLAGDGEMLEVCKKYVLEHDLSNSVSFLGRLSREALRNRMQQARVFLISSQHETFGVVAIEAMSCGLHVIATRCGGPEDILMENGRLSGHDTESFAQAMIDAYTKQSEFPSHVNRQYAVAHFGQSAVGSALRSLYSRIIR